MDKVKAFLEDKKNLPIVVGGFAVILIVVVFFLLKMTGVIGGGGAPDMNAMNQGMPGSPGTPGQTGPVTPPGGPPANPGAPGPGVPPQPAMPGAPAQPGMPSATGPTAAALEPMLPYRKDPFLPFAGLPSKKDILAVFLPSLQRPRIAPAPVVENQMGTQAAEVPPPQPFRRMAGVLWNGRVKAILETAGETDIVQPGDIVNRGNSKVQVESITQDTIVLKTLDTRTPMTVKVGMSGSVTGNSATANPTGPEMYPNGPY